MESSTKKHATLRRKLCIILVIALACVVLLIAACNVIVNSNANHRTYDSADAAPTYPTALLLGTGPNNRFSNGVNMFYVNRLRATVELFRKGKFQRLIISGTKRPGYDEPLIIKTDLVRMGLPDSVMVLDRRGSNTLCSIQNARDVYHQSSLIIISQKWHCQRALYMADHLGIRAVGFNAADVQTYTAHLTHLRELLARVKAVFALWFNSTKKQTN